MADWIKSVVETLGYPGIALLMILENVFPPIPSEIIMPFAGFAASQGTLSFLGVVIAGMVGSVLGALPLYYLGAWAGEERVKRWADEYGRWLTLSSRDVERACSARWPPSSWAGCSRQARRHCCFCRHSTSGLRQPPILRNSFEKAPGTG